MKGPVSTLPFFGSEGLHADWPETEGATMHKPFA